MQKRVWSVLAGLIAAMFAGFAMADDAKWTIADIAPRRSFLVLSVRNCTELRADFDKSSFGALWREPGVQNGVEKLYKELMPTLDEALASADAKRDDLTMPTGGIGLALTLDEKPPPADAADRPARRPRSPEVQLGFVAAADYGVRADAMNDTIERFLARLTRDKRIETRDETYRGTRITTITALPQPKDKAKAANPDQDAAPDEPPAADDLLFFLNDRPVHFARLGSAFAAGTDLPAIEAAVDAAAGKPAESVASSDDYRQSLAQHPANAAITAVLLMEPLWPMIRRQLDDQFAREQPAVKPWPILEALGLSELRAASIGARLNTPDASAEQTIGILVPKKAGLVALLTDAAAEFNPPAFVGPDTTSVTRLPFRVSQLVDVARGAGETFGPETRDQVKAMIDQGAGVVGPGLASLGPEIYLISNYRQPFAADSTLFCAAIQCSDPLVIQNMLTQAAQYAPLEPRDFNGNTIYAAEDVGIAAGIGFGQLFIGNIAGVENAMRLAGNPQGDRLATQPGFKRAVAVLGPGAVVYSYTDMGQELRHSYWQIEHAADLAREGMDLSRYDPETRAMIEKSLPAGPPEWFKDVPPVEVLLRHLGDTVSEWRSTPDGFRARWLMLPAAPR